MLPTLSRGFDSLYPLQRRICSNFFEQRYKYHSEKGWYFFISKCHPRKDMGDYRKIKKQMKEKEEKLEKANRQNGQSKD